MAGKSYYIRPLQCRYKLGMVQEQVVIRSQQTIDFPCLSRVSWASSTRKPGIGLGILGLVDGYFEDRAHSLSFQRLWLTLACKLWLARALWYTESKHQMSTCYGTCTRSKLLPCYNFVNIVSVVHVVHVVRLVHVIRVIHVIHIVHIFRLVNSQH